MTTPEDQEDSLRKDTQVLAWVLWSNIAAVLLLMVGLIIYLW